MLRDHCNHEELEAHRILDLAKAGLEVPVTTVVWALFVLGDGVGLDGLAHNRNPPFSPFSVTSVEGCHG